MYRNGFDADILYWSVLFTHWRSFDIVKYGKSINNLAKYCIFAIEVSLRAECEEELAPIVVGTFIGISQHTTFLKCELTPDLILKWLIPNAGTALSRTAGVPSLHHEPRHVAMELGAIILITRAERKEVLTCARTKITK